MLALASTLLPQGAHADTIFGEANDQALRMARPIPGTIDLGGGGVGELNLPVGKSGNTNGFVRQSVMVFQLPDLGAVTDPFGSAVLKVFHVSENVPSGAAGGDLYGMTRRDALPDVTVGDFHSPPFETQDAANTLLQDDFLTSTGLTPNTQITTDAAGSTALKDFLNSQYDGGNGALEYVFIRMSADADIIQRWNIESTDGAADDTQRPQIEWLPASNSVETIQVETADDGSGTVVPAQTLTSGDPAITVYSIGRDGANAFIDNVIATWSLSNVTGDILPGDLVPAGDGKSATFTPTGAGTAEITVGGVANNFVGSGTITVVAGPASQLFVETAADGSGAVVPDTFLFVGGDIDAFAISRDAQGNFVANEAAATFSLVNITGTVDPADLLDNADGSANYLAAGDGTCNIRASLGGFTDADSGLITSNSVAPNRYDGGGSVSSWQLADNWVADTLPPGFAVPDDMTDLFFVADPTFTKRFTYLAADITVRSITFDTNDNGQFTASLVETGNASPANLTFDTDSGSAAFTVTSDSDDPITFGRASFVTEGDEGTVILADNLLITHDGSALLTFNAEISETGGSHGVTKTGTGTVAFTGINSYTGSTTVSDGILEITGDSIPGALIIDGTGVVDVTGTEFVSSLQLGGGAVQTGGTFDATSDPAFISGPGTIVVGSPPSGGEIEISDISFTGVEEVTLTFTSSTNVDVYGSVAPDGLIWDLFESNVPPGTWVDTLASPAQTFYILVPTGDPAPADSP